MSEKRMFPRHAGGVTERDLGQEIVFYDGNGDRFHVLNATAREIYLLSDGTRSPDAIARALMERYEVSEETARKDTLETIERLMTLGLLTDS